MEVVVFEEPAFAGRDFVICLTAARVFFVIEDLSTIGTLLENFLLASASASESEEEEEEESREEEAEVLSSRFDLAIRLLAGLYL